MAVCGAPERRLFRTAFCTGWTRCWRLWTDTGQRGPVTTGIEGPAEALELGDGQGFEVGAGLGVGEEAQVRDVFATAGGLLGEVVGPAEELEQGADEVLFGLGFVGVVVVGEVLEEAAGREEGMRGEK